MTLLEQMAFEGLAMALSAEEDTARGVASEWWLLTAELRADFRGKAVALLMEQQAQGFQIL